MTGKCTQRLLLTLLFFAFYRPLCTKLQVEMFAGAYNFDRILTWNVERVVDFSYMFHDAISFNQYLNWNPISALYMVRKTKKYKIPFF